MSVKKIYLAIVLMSFGPLMLAQNSIQNLSNYFVQNIEQGDLTHQDLQHIITSEHTSRVSGVKHIYFRQTINDIEIYGTDSSLHLNRDGSTLAISNKFLGNVQGKVRGSVTPSINARQAINSAANQLGYQVNESLNIIESNSNKSQEQLFSQGGISLRPIPTKLVYYTDDLGAIKLAWDLSIEAVDRLDWWSVRVDASSGEIVNQVNWMVSCSFEHNHDEHSNILDYNKNLFDIPNYAKNEETAAACVECYEVFPLPLESPYYGVREEVINPANLIASPFGWHDTNGVSGAEFTTTKGNNVDAFDAGDNPGYRPDGGTDLDFSGYPFDQNYTTTNQYEDAAIAQLFYSNNILHDVMYQYGFDEAAGNFQENNYGNGGAGSDSVNANSQIAQNCNATFGTPADGGNPTMNMFVCGNKDGNFDTLVVFHEYGHGISNRLTGGPASAGCLGNTEQMGEGWSDFIGAALTIETGDVGTDSRGVGTYLFGQGPNGGGIRSFPYSTDLTVNPQTYDDIKTESVPHGVGSVWATTLWEMTWALIDEYGFDEDVYNFTGDINLDAGNVIAMALVTEGMKLQPCSPGFVDGRDAIFAADAAIYGGANECILWDAFAKRGLGVNADQGSSNDRSDGTESFDTPSQLASFTSPTDDLCASSGVLANLGGGSPNGGEYSGPGVTDDNNGLTFTFDPNAAGVGVHTITYAVDATDCSIASSATDTIEVIAVDPGPVVTGGSAYCPGDTVTLNATLSDPANIINWYDAPVGGNIVFTGETYTFTPSGTQDLYAAEVPNEPLSQLVISELNLQLPDLLEIQNVGIEADYSGYTVAVSDQPYANINSVNTITQTLGMMSANSVMAWSDGSGAAPWGNNIFWDQSDPGWILIIDDNGNVVDSLFWNSTAAEISTFNVTINGFTITAADLDWTGDGATFTQTCNGTSFRRIGESDDASNWANNCTTADFGTANTDIGFGFTGCLGERTLVVLTDSEGPEITCPADVTVPPNSGNCEATGVAIGNATATDNCGLDTLVNDAPSVYPAGPTVVTWTATDVNGNVTTCEQIITVTDTVDPTITCLADVTTGTDSGVCTSSIFLDPPAANDDCGVASLTNDAPTDFPLGTTLVTWTVMDNNGNSATCTQNVTVTDEEDPSLVCPADTTVVVDQGATYTIPDYTTMVVATDNCSTNLVVTQDVVAGTEVGEGTYPIVMSTIDDAGNTSDCTFNLIVSEVLGVSNNVLFNAISVYPNPTSGLITIENKSLETIESLSVIDINGRVIKLLRKSTANNLTQISLDEMASGLYFIRINTVSTSVIKRIVRK